MMARTVFTSNGGNYVKVKWSEWERREIIIDVAWLGLIVEQIPRFPISFEEHAKGNCSWSWYWTYSDDGINSNALYIETEVDVKLFQNLFQCWTCSETDSERILVLESILTENFNRNRSWIYPGSVTDIKLIPVAWLIWAYIGLGTDSDLESANKVKSALESIPGQFRS